MNAVSRSPRWWPSRAGLLLLKVLAQLPYPAQLRLGRAAGWLIDRLMGYRGSVARTNLGLCFPDWEEERREQLYRSHMESLGISLFEMAMAWWADDRRLQGLYRIEGLEHLQAAHRQQQGVILLSAHFTCLELAGRFLNQHHPLSVTYRDFKNPVFHQAMIEARNRLFARALSRSDTRGFIRALKQGHTVWYAPDQDMGREHSVFAPFFGIPAATLTTTSRIARAGNARVMFFQVRRDDSKAAYVLKISPPLDGFPHRQAEQDAITINRLIEAAVREAPEQYLWIHRRFKTRPPGEPKFYPVKPRRRKRRNHSADSMQRLDSTQFEALIRDAEVLSLDLHGPKVYRTSDAKIIKLFRNKRRLSLNQLFPYAERFRRNADRLRALGFLTVTVETVFKLPETGQRAVVYAELDGKSCREMLAEEAVGRHILLQRLADYIALLHRKGVYFRSLHLGNIMALGNDRLGLIDVADMKLQSRALSCGKRARNLVHLLRYRDDWPLFSSAGPAGFLSAYLDAADCDEACRETIRNGLRARLPELLI